MENVTSQDVLEFWFSSAQKSLWYAKDEKFDADIRQRFLPTYEAAYAGELDEWRSTPESLLALIILLDQFPRNMFRGSPRAFASDAYALRLTKEGIERGFHGSLRGAQLDFFLLPLMHSESLAYQDQCLALFRALCDVAPAAVASRFANFLDYAERHRDVIQRFGRFPHRNALLGRESSAEELAFLREPGSSF